MPDTLTVITTIATRAVLEALAPALRAATGCTIAPTFGAPGKVVERVRAGEPADVVMATPEGMAELAAAGKVAGPGRVFARMQMGVGIRAGAPKPDIGTVESFRRALLAARAITYADPESGSPSAAHFLKVAEQLGIAAALKPKAVTLRGLAAVAVADGRAELAIQQLSEILMVEGVEPAGPFPEELQNIVPLAASVHAQSAHPAAAQALIDLLAAPSTRALIEQAGMRAP